MPLKLYTDGFSQIMSKSGNQLRLSLQILHMVYMWLLVKYSCISCFVGRLSDDVLIKITSFQQHSHRTDVVFRQGYRKQHGEDRNS